MKNYTFAVGTEDTTALQPACQFLDLVVGSVDVQIKLRKSPKAASNSEEGEFMTLKATKHYQIKARKGAFWAIIHKASQASTLTVMAMNDTLIIVP